MAASLALAACAGDLTADDGDDDFGGDSGGGGGGAEPGDEDGGNDGDGGDDGTDEGGGDGDGDTGDGADEPGVPTCDGVDCFPGVCVDHSGAPVCECPDGYAAVGLSCMECTPIGDPADLDVPMVELTGNFTINTVLAPPQSEYDDARVYLRNVGTGDEVLLGNTHDGTFAQSVVPGTYELFYELENGGFEVPANRRAKLDTLTITSSEPRDIDIEMETVRGDITLNGLVPPGEVYENGRVYLRNVGTGDEVLLGETRDGSYRVKVIPGTYAVYYALEQGGAKVPANGNGFVTAVEIQYLDETDFTLDIDIPMVTVNGDFTVAGNAPPASQYDAGRIVLRDVARDDEIVLGSTRDGAFSARLLPGTYEVHYRSTQAGGTVPANVDAIVDTMDVPNVIEAPITRPVDVPAVTLEGEITVDGTPPPSSFNDDGRILVRNAATGDVAVLGNTHDGGFMQVVVPGDYDIHYGQESSSGGVPENTNARLDSITVDQSMVLDVDIPAVPVAGTVTLDGQVPPTSQYDDGRLYLRDRETGDSVLLGSTRAGSFTAYVVPGTYDVHYVVETDSGTVPVNTDAYVETVVVALGSPLSIDVPVADLGGSVLVNGAMPAANPGDLAHLYLQDVATDDHVYLAGVADGSYDQRLVAGRYVLYYRAEATTGAIPANTNAGLRCFDVQ